MKKYKQTVHPIIVIRQLTNGKWTWTAEYGYRKLSNAAEEASISAAWHAVRMAIGYTSDWSIDPDRVHFEVLKA